ncbi:hypothetical protein KSF_048600 [Reticulibacter mediterranei]|uniref:Uncharacterized protein n=1 Tax=Reticulibacter mediterranei TaxID=2778369 RepID=A0A8J3IPX5_9CHLR|nr:hypothetical protein KSF_048600 [Reticulibacter mediterranei]
MTRHGWFFVRFSGTMIVLFDASLAFGSEPVRHAETVLALHVSLVSLQAQLSLLLEMTGTRPPGVG